jgi:phage baseplate assembly protein W
MSPPGTDLWVLTAFTVHDAGAYDLTQRARAARTVTPDGRVDLGGVAEVSDLATVGGREDLAQALLLRLLTPLGSLASLGHAGYGSRLGTLVGRRKTGEMRNLCRAFVLEVVRQEPRVQDTAVAFAFDPAAEGPDSLVFTLAVRPQDGGADIAVSLEVGL